MKAKQIDGNITTYKTLPSEYKKADGKVILNFRNADIDTLEAEGFYNVVKPTYDSRIEKLGNIKWDSKNKYFTYPKSDKTISKTLAELKAIKKQAVKDLANTELLKTDWYVTRKADLGTAIPDEINTERASVRTKVVEREAEVDALSTKKKVATWDAILFDPPEDDLPI
jgi:hypothetical protein